MLARRYLPSIPSLLALEAVERLGSASAAAAELNLTQGAISRQLQTLEGQLGVALVIRDRHRLRLTPAAQDFVAEARQSLHRLAQASLTLRANPGGGALTLAILPAFGMHWLAPRLARFAGLHPEVTVNLSTRLKPFDFEGSAFDAAIHYGRPDIARQDWPGTDDMKLMDEDILAVAAPALAPAPLAQAKAVLDLPLLQLESRTGDWGRWLAYHGQPNLRPPAMLFDQFATMQQAAILGMGAALLPLFLIERDLAERRLIPLYGPAIRALGSYHLVWPRNRPPRAPLTSFRSWLARNL
ncbi:LysR family transcriptional regulator [bacterium]|nr:LysR family transcriptional regulator [bacterium]